MLAKLLARLMLKEALRQCEQVANQTESKVGS